VSTELDTEHLEVFARGAVAEHGMPDAEITLLNVSENATFRADAADGRRLVLRVHRTGYHSREAIESELAWISALRADGIVHTAPVIPTPDGRDIVVVRHPGGEERNVVAFEWMNGVEPPEDRLVDDFRELGAITARLHRHAREWERPAGFTRFRWDFDTSLGANGHWGRWQDGMGMGPAELDVLGRAAGLVQRRLERFGTGPDRYVPELVEAWVTGYQRVSPLSSADVQELATFIMLRRLLLVAWIGSHAMTETAQGLGPEYTVDSCRLAEEYLSRTFIDD